MHTRRVHTTKYIILTLYVMHMLIPGVFWGVFVCIDSESQPPSISLDITQSRVRCIWDVYLTLMYGVCLLCGVFVYYQVFRIL